MADRLIVMDSTEGFCIAWYLQEEGDTGAVIGEMRWGEVTKFEGSKDPDERLWFLAERLCQEEARLHPDELVQYRARGYTWDSRARAALMLKRIKAQFQAQESGRPLPEWAKTAMAAGWKPPKGWKP